MSDIVQTKSETVSEDITTNSSTSKETVRTRYYEPNSNKDLSLSETAEIKTDNDNTVTLRKNTVALEQEYNPKKIRKPFIITAIALALICTVSAICLNNVAKTEDNQPSAFSSTETAEVKATNRIDEKIKFEKSSYSVEVRKTVQLVCDYSYKELGEETTATTTLKNANKTQTEKTSEKATSKATEKTSEKATTKATEKTSETATTKATEKATEKSSNAKNDGIRYISSNIDIATVDSNGIVKGVSTGTTSIMAISPSGTYNNVTITVTAPKSYTIKNVPLIYQGDDYPSGCESVSATMLLKYYGFDISVNDFIDKYLKMDYFSYENGKMCGPDPYSAFIGSPYTDASLGCFPPVIENAINKYFKNKNYRAVDITGSSMESITNNYIANGQPVVIWATMWLQDPVPTYEWTVRGSADYSPYNNGDTYQWLGNEHCMLLIGYDEDYYYINDPLNNDSVAKYSRQEFDFRYKQMGKCALIIENTN